MQLQKYGKLHESSMISAFSYMKIVWPKQEKISLKIRWRHFSKMYEICMNTIFS